MLNKLVLDTVRPGDTVICAVSGGADSTALLLGLYLKKEELGIRLEAAHFNHQLRGAESDGDEAFVRDICHRFDIPLHVGSSQVTPGKKGLEAAAREARYAFFATLSGKIATAHTADDNAETVLLHLVRGTGLKGLGGIAPVNGSIVRPMLNITRSEVLAFLAEYNLPYRTDSSNQTDAFLRNRLRRHVMPLLKAENPRLAENLSAMAQRLRQDEAVLTRAAEYGALPDVTALRQLDPAIRCRMLERFLKENGVKEPEAEHISLAEALVFSEKPSACGHFPGGVTIVRRYDRLAVLSRKEPPQAIPLPQSGSMELPHLGLRITCGEAEKPENSEAVFTVRPAGPMVLRPRQGGDKMRLPGGTKLLKKLFVDRKIPAHERPFIPVIADEQGVLGVYGIGVNLDRACDALPAIRIHIVKTEKKAEG